MKLSEYVEGMKQPAIQLFKAVRIFDPKQLPLLSHAFSNYANVTADEWETYIDIAAWESSPEDVTSFSSSAENRLPKLAASANAYPAIPIGSADVEWSVTNVLNRHVYSASKLQIINEKERDK